MTEDVKRAIAALCANRRNGFLMVGGAEYSVKCSDIAMMLERLTVELEQVKRERDAAIYDLTEHGQNCHTCRHYDKTVNDDPCSNCRGGYIEEHWQWRGVCAENGGKKND